MAKWPFSSGSKGKSYSRDEFHAKAEPLMWYRALAKTVGGADATRVVDLIFDQWGNRGTITLTPQTEGAIHALLEQEVMRIQGRKVHIGQLSGQARSGSLRNRMAGRTLAPGEYCNDPGASDLNKAYRWIVKSWRGQGAGAVRAALWENGQTEGGGTGLGSDDTKIANVHATIVQGAPARRPPSTHPVPYPSHVGGRYLLRWIFGVVAGAGWPPRGNDQWDDWALFFLGSIVAAQGFTDGNKRLGRTAYGIVLLKGGRPFRAPTVDLENELYAM